MRRCFKLFVVLILSGFLSSHLIASSNTSDYTSKVDNVVEKFIRGEILEQSEMEILSKIISSNNSRFFDVYSAYKMSTSRKNNTKSNINFDNIFDQFNAAIEGNIQEVIFKNQYNSQKYNSVQASIFDEFADGGGDASELLNSAHDASGAYSQITGTLLDGADFDVYKISVIDPNNFSIYMDTNFDVMIHLFDSDGFLIATNDDSPVHPLYGMTLQSYIPPGNTYGPTEPGIYYIAILGYWDVPLDVNDNIMSDWWFGLNPDDNWVYGPSTTPGPFDHWWGPHGNSGNYTVNLTGTGSLVVLPPVSTGEWTIREDTYFRKTFPHGPNYSASSNTYFAQPRFNGNVLYITLAANWHGTARITVNASGQSKDYYLRVVSVNDRPVIFPITDQILEANQVGTVTLGGRDVDNDILTFTATSDNENLMTAVTNRTLTLTPAPDWSGTTSVTVLVSDGFLTDAWIFDVTVNTPVSVVQRNLSGILYYGDDKDNVSGNIIQLRDGENVVYETIADDTGEFNFGLVNNGYYQIDIVREDNADPITAADALITARLSMDDENLTTSQMQLLAADVDASQSITGGDALSILNKIIGRIDDFEREEWILSRSEVGVGAIDLNFPLKSIKTGDVDISLLNATIGKRNILQKTDRTIIISNSEEIIVPVTLSELQDLSAFDLSIKYDSDNLEFLGVNSNLNILSNAVDDEIKLAWLNSNLDNPVSLKEGVTLFELRLRAINELPTGYTGSFQPTEGEFLTKDGNYQYPLISVPSISDATPISFDLAQNYPNPFNPSTQISYSLPVSGQVEVSIFNVVGEKVATLLNTQQPAGTHKVEWKADNYSSGVYFYTINVTGEQNYHNTKKMLLIK